MTYQQNWKDLAQNGDIRGNRQPNWALAIVVLALFSLVLGTLLYGLYNANQIERAARNECVITRDATC